MPRHSHHTLIFFIYVMASAWPLSGCKDNSIKPRESLPKPTPYTLETPSYLPGYTIPEDNPLTQEGVELGRKLFFDPILSSTRQISCSSCHKPEFAFSDNVALSTGVHGRKGLRTSMALSNLLWTKKDFFWDGRATSLEHQALFPIQDSLEMNLSLDQMISRLRGHTSYPRLFKIAFQKDSITPQDVAKALAQFQRTLISTNSKFDRYLQGKIKLTEKEELGRQLFYTHPEPRIRLRGANCSDCHAGFLQTDYLFHNNGLDKVYRDKGLANRTGKTADDGKFRTPSLRNIALTAPYMHDGRFNTLEEVLDHYNEHIKKSPQLDVLIIEATNTLGGNQLDLTPEEKEAVIAFLHTLTDSSFITNPKFQKP